MLVARLCCTIYTSMLRLTLSTMFHLPKLHDRSRRMLIYAAQSDDFGMNNDIEISLRNQLIESIGFLRVTTLHVFIVKTPNIT